MIVSKPAVLGVLYASVLYFCIGTCSAQLSMLHLDRRSRCTLIIIIIIISSSIIIKSSSHDPEFPFTIKNELTSQQHASVSQGWICLTSQQQASVSQGRICLTSQQQASVSQGRICLTSQQQASVSLNIPATGQCVSGTDLLGHVYVLPH